MPRTRASFGMDRYGSAAPVATRSRLYALCAMLGLLALGTAQAASDGLYEGEDAPAEVTGTLEVGLVPQDFTGVATAPLPFERHVLAAARETEVEPALIHAVISVESGYNPAARSRGGALGLMQLMPGTARRYGVTNRLDPAQNILGGARYLRDLMALFDNNLRLVLAAYNAGEQAVIRYDRQIPPFRATAMFVNRVMVSYRAFSGDPPIAPAR